MMPMLLSLLSLAAGLALLIGGADLLVRGVSALARAVGVPPLVVGLTVVAFGTSMPEVVVNTMSAARQTTDLAFGNIVGSCAINIGFVLAITALIRPLTVEPSVITREIPMMLLGVAAIMVMSADVRLSGGAVNSLNRSDGIVLLLLFCVFLYSTVMTALMARHTDALVAEVQVEQGEAQVQAMRRSLWTDAGFTVAGLIGVAAGGRITVDAAVTIATSLSVPPNVIGLTLVSFGTTLPELATGILAARRGHADIAIGNVVGSNIFNILFIGGMVSTIHPITVPPGGYFDLIFMAALSAALLPVAIRGPRRITRAEGAALLAAYLICLSYRSFSVVAMAARS
jgi:cation:H+ antiporter